ncbi:MAG TPA: arylsulfotransferase family protein [Solirubrobacteraceae bacterium]|nr:arylsulfotransferase family protein [Solirubrobacteraceae bacterium]
MRSSKPPPSGAAGKRLKSRRVLGGVVSALVGLSVAGCGSSARLVTVFPIPGGRVASPQTQVVFRGISPGKIGRVVVTGSRSGRHTGRLEADSDGQGASFLPTKPFTPGEVVTVKTGLRVRGVRAGTFHFTVATPAGAVPSMPLAPAARVPGDELTFQSRPDLTPASVEITKQSGQTAPGDIFVTPQQGPTQNGAMILDPSGNLVWFHPVPTGDMAADLRVQSYQGKPVLTWWQGYSGAGIGDGEDVIDDSSYRQVAVVHAGNGLYADLHEFRLTSQGTALITAYYPVYWNASSLHGSKQQIVLDSVVQEIDIKTGLVLFQWDSLDHVPLSDSYETMPKSAGSPFDYFHVNSIQQAQNGDLIVSARNTWAAYEIDPRTGGIVWTLGGKHSTFKLGAGVQFAFQHDVVVHTKDHLTVTLFDDGGGPPRLHAQSRAIRVALDGKHKTATLVTQDLHAPALTASFEGNVQALAGGDEFVGWGQQPYFSEFDSSGQMVFDARFVGDNSSYRAYRYEWTGTPTAPPDVAAATSGAMTDVYASWNGATQVSDWRVLAGASSNSLRAVETAPKQGFETQIEIPSEPYVRVQALDHAGGVLGTSETVQAK